MKLQYLGTAAAEGWPAIFCTCDCCRRAKELGGKNIRTRSQALVNDNLLIDFPPDTYMHYLTYGFDLPGITDLLITHSHHDHFFADDLEMRCDPFGNVPPMNIYGNDKVEAAFQKVLGKNEKLPACYAFHRLELFRSVQVGSYRVTPLRANHDKSELCLIYLIDDGEKTLLYGHDTGNFPEDTWDYLQGKRMDLVSLDCTCQSEAEGSNHMGLADVAAVQRRMLEQGMADGDTTFVVAHFSHNGKWDHATMEQKAAEYDILTAYDGMAVEV